MAHLRPESGRRAEVVGKERPLRILQAGSDICGIPGLLARELRARGHDARALRYAPNDFGYSGDITVPEGDAASAGRRMAARLRTLVRESPRWDIFHLHAFDGLLPYSLDLPVLRLLTRKLVVHYHGCDVRQVAAAKKPDVVYCPSCEMRPDCSLRRQQWRLAIGRAFAHRTICATPDLLAAVPEALYVPNPVDLFQWSERPALAREGRAFRIVHIPSDPVLKGTRHLVAAVQEVRRRGVAVELEMVTGVAHSRMPELYACSDLVFDQVNVGWYGLAAIEAMALGRPVAAYLRPGVARANGEPPIYRVTRQTLADDLQRAIEHPHELRALAARGRQYVEETHDASKVAARIDAVYSELCGRSG